MFMNMFILKTYVLAWHTFYMYAAYTVPKGSKEWEETAQFTDLYL